MTDDARILEEDHEMKNNILMEDNIMAKKLKGTSAANSDVMTKTAGVEVEIEVEKEAKGETDGNPKKNTTKGVIITEHMKVSTVLTMKALKNVKMYS